MSDIGRDHFLVATYEHMSLNATPTLGTPGQATGSWELKPTISSVEGNFHLAHSRLFFKKNVLKKVVVHCITFEQFSLFKICHYELLKWLLS